MGDLKPEKMVVPRLPPGLPVLVMNVACECAWRKV
jgi:hypothetical protein